MINLSHQLDVSSFGCWLIRQAAHRLPEAERLDTEMEWLAHLDDLSKPKDKLLHAFGSWRSAQTGFLLSTWKNRTDKQIRDILVYFLWMVSCWSLILDIKFGPSLSEIAPHLLGVILCAGPAIRFVLVVPTE